MHGKRLIVFVGVAFLALFLIFYSGEDSRKAEEASTYCDIVTLCSSVEGVGECRVSVVFESAEKSGSEKVYSVAVICEGADNVKVRARLTELITTLYGIGANRVSIIKLSK